MARQKLWFKKRTTRGAGRSVRGRTKMTTKNLNREIYKNQRIYSIFFLKFVLYMMLGIVWLRLGMQIGPLRVLPIGLAIGLVFTMFERFRIGRRIEIIILIAATVISYFTPVGVTL